jgi:hypothetical protein
MEIAGADLLFLGLGTIIYGIAIFIVEKIN